MAEISYGATVRAIEEGTRKAIIEIIRQATAGRFETSSDLILKAVQEGVKEWLKDNKKLVAEVLKEGGKQT